jgi:predicted membrane protein
LYFFFGLLYCPFSLGCSIVFPFVLFLWSVVLFVLLTAQRKRTKGQTIQQSKEKGQTIQQTKEKGQKDKQYNSTNKKDITPLVSSNAS